MKQVVNEDDRILYKNVVGTVGIKGLSIIISFLTTSMYVSYFCDSLVLGIWFTLLSILSWILTFDFGVGNGLRNRIAPHLEAGNELEIRQYVSSGYITIGVISAIVTIVGGLFVTFGDWNRLLNITTNDISTYVLRVTILVTFIGIILQFVLKLITSILYALRKNILANGTLLISNIMLCVYLAIGTHFEMDSSKKLILLAIVYSVTIIVPLLVATVWVFGHDLKGYLPSIKFFDYQKGREVVSLGGVFFLIQLELLVMTSTDSWLIMYLFSAEDVVSYQIYYKLFSLPTTMFALLSQPLWSSITIALAKKDIVWIKNKEKMIYLIAAFVSLLCVIEVVLSSGIIRLWIGTGGCEINMIVAIWFGVLSIGQLFMFASTSIANGISKLGCQAICNFIAVVLKFTLTFVLAAVINHWVCVIIVETIGTLIVAIAQPIVNRSNLKRLIS